MRCVVWKGKVVIAERSTCVYRRDDDDVMRQPMATCQGGHEPVRLRHAIAELSLPQSRKGAPKPWHRLESIDPRNIPHPLTMSLCATCRRHGASSLKARTASPATQQTRSTSSLHKTAWPSKTHLRPNARMPNPLPAIYPQLVILSDGSSFTSYTTAPSPAVYRLTRDVTNNPLWNLNKDGGVGRRGEGEEEGGRLARFKRLYGETSAATSQTNDQQPSTSAPGLFETSDLDWMSSEAGKVEKVSAKEMAGPQKVAKGKKK